MRKVVCQMMMTLNGRVDDPMAWMSELSNEQYEFIDQAYAQFDTVLVGRVTYDEMFASWPKARADKDASKAHKSMAERMHRYRKIVITTKNFSPQWNNSEAAICKGDHDVQSLVARLKNADGEGIHLSGGARLAQTLANSTSSMSTTSWSIRRSLSATVVCEGWCPSLPAGSRANSVPWGRNCDALHPRATRWGEAQAGIV